MPKLKASLVDMTGALGGGPGLLQTRLKTFQASVLAAQREAARSATGASRANVRRVRDLAPPRANRYHGLKDAIRWHATPDGGVALAVRELTAKFPPWLVQEIGTGQRAIQKVAGRPNPQGRPTKGAAYVKTVRSQRGRRISPGLVFATSGGEYSPPNYVNRHNQQLYLRSQVKNAPVRFNPKTRRSAAGITISREIKGQHFIQKGGEEGFREYRQSVLAAARSQLRKRK